MTETVASVAAVIPALNEQDTIAATVRAASAIDGVDLVVVVDDGSRDATARRARDAGARIVVHSRNRGKAAAMVTGAALVEDLEREAGQAPRALLFIDADLGETARATAPLTVPVLAGAADATIAVLPRQRTAGGGHGFVVGLASRGIERATGWRPTQPLSGMRCLTREAYRAVQPFAFGWGVETGMTIDLLRAGLRVTEVPCELQHRVTGADLRGQLHRAAQYRDVWLALAVRRLGLRRGHRR